MAGRMQADHATTTTTTSSPHSSSERSSSSAPHTDSKEGMESDEEIGRVPEFGMEVQKGGTSTSGKEHAAAAGASSSSAATQAAARRRGRSPADKEHRRLKSLSPEHTIEGRTGFTWIKAWIVGTISNLDSPPCNRLLRNRVSAQQARERKKAYMSELQVKVKELEKRNSELEERLSTLQNENQMLRQILKNTTVNRRGPGNSTGGGDNQ